MMGYGYDMGAGGWIAMVIFWVAVVTLIVWAISRATPTGRGGVTDSAPFRTGARDGDTGTAEDILDRRFAAGELDDDTYHSMLTTLRTSRSESR